MTDWRGREKAASLRQWPTLAWIAERVQHHPQLEGLIVIGSFAKGSADNASDLDLIAVVALGAFEQVWAAREGLEPPGTLFAWDQTDDLEAEESVRKFLTRDIVKVELVFTTGLGFVLAEPHVVAVGPDTVLARFEQRGAISREDLGAYAQARVEAGVVRRECSASGRQNDIAVVV